MALQLSIHEAKPPYQSNGHHKLGFLRAACVIVRKLKWRETPVTITCVWSARACAASRGMARGVRSDAGIMAGVWQTIAQGCGVHYSGMGWG
eukprot:1196228-Prorocentrum_minimum.AAC.6